MWKNKERVPQRGGHGGPPLQCVPSKLGTIALRRELNYFFPPDCTVVVSVELLLIEFGSFVLEFTVTVLVSVVLPRTITVTSICAVSRSPGCKLPRFHVIVPVCPA